MVEKLEETSLDQLLGAIPRHSQLPGQGVDAHGTTDTTHMTHLALTGRTGGSNVEWGEAVNDGQYLAVLDEQ
jgi:hypothetical protein